MYTLNLESSTLSVPLAPEQSLLDACLTHGVALPYNCRSGECGQCVARLVCGSTHELPGADPATYTDAMRASGLVLTCMSYPRSDILLDVPAIQSDQPQIREFDAVIDSVRWFGARTARVIVRSADPVPFRGGQYFEWHAPGAGRARSYSAANVPGGNLIEFLVRIYPGGRISKLLQRHELAAGDVLSLRGPFGTYAFAPEEPGTAIFIAGGTGLAPVASIVQSALVGGAPGRPLAVFFGARDQAELESARSLQEAACRVPSLQFVPVLSDEPDGSAWTGRRGMVVDALRETLGDQFGAQAYLCGPPAMVDAAIPILERCGLARSDIYCDRFVPAVSEEATA
ncbi:MAG TPA: 2Fe-2S iron-sulfur cluster binding domain-containing protein [Variovorax sp.]